MDPPAGNGGGLTRSADALPHPVFSAADYSQRSMPQSPVSVVRVTPQAKMPQLLYARCQQRIATALESRGFTRRRTLLAQRRASGNWLVIKFQKSRESTLSNVRLTLNVGVVSTVLARAAGGPLVALEAMPTSAWHLLERIGRWTPAGDDRWWSIADEADVDVAVDEIERALVLALDELDGMVSDEQLRDLWLSERSPGLTDGQRLFHLGELLAAIGPAELLPAVLDDLRRRSPVMAHTLERRLAAPAP